MASASKITILYRVEKAPSLEEVQEIATLCRKGLHDLSLPGARTTTNRCRACHRASDLRYRHSEKGRQNTARYYGTEVQQENKHRSRYGEFRRNLKQRILRNILRLKDLEGEV